MEGKEEGGKVEKRKERRKERSKGRKELYPNSGGKVVIIFEAKHLELLIDG